MTDLALRKAARELCRQIGIGDFADSLGHAAKMLKAYHDTCTALAAPEPGFEAWFDEHRHYGECKNACREAFAAGLASKDES